MRVDVLTIFPEYLDPLGLSLVGKARRDGRLDVRVHDLRAWALDRHRSVDDSPAGGGAGMVMRPDVWGRALDDVLPAPEADSAGPVLLVPTPSGRALTQSLAAELAREPHLVIACGRYEGIDSRVAEHYGATGKARVLEVSIGDYVLNGGEAAALVLVEAVARLLPGVLGNPDSLVQESHGVDGLLEGPVYTRPVSWRGLDIPVVLLSGNHGEIARWARDRAIERTAGRRPDLIAGLDVAGLDRADRSVLASLGWVEVAGRLVRFAVREAGPADVDRLVAFAADTFRDACPPGTAEADIRAHVVRHLSRESWFERVGSPERNLVIVAESAAGLLGYVLAVLPAYPEEPPADPDVASAVPERPAAELSKCYVRADLRGKGLASALVEATHAELATRRVASRPVAAVWLGTNESNRRARRCYARLGYLPVGRRRFRVGSTEHSDVVMSRPLGELP